MSRRHRPALLALPVVLALASCGGGSLSPTSTRPSPGAPPASSGPPPRSAAPAPGRPPHPRDARRGVVYAVAFLAPARHELAALDLASGRVRWRRAIDPPGADPKVHQQRGALALANGRVYVSFGGLFGDCGNYHGWVVSASAS